jgi:Flp pilus assembly protein TadD
VSRPNNIPRSPAAAAAAIVVLTVLAYWPAFGNGFIWDDDAYVTDNMTLRSFDGLERIWLERGAVPQYYPLTHTTFWIEYQLWGNWAAGYHTVNILLHALAAVLLWRLLLRLEVRGAWLIAAIFALHPVMVESVAWITERKNVLSGVLALAALIAYWRFKPGGEGRRFYALSLLCFIGALLSKSVTVTLGPVILLLTWWKSGRITKRDIALTLPMFAIGLVASLNTIWMERHVVGAQGELFNLGFPDRILIAGRALWFYAGKMVWPHNLTFIYPRWTIDPALWWQWLYPAGAVALMLVLFALRKRIGRGPLTAVLLFAGMLFPALGFFDVYPMRFSFVADHFNYLSAIGVIALVVSLLVRLPGVRPGVGGGVILIALGVMTWRQTPIYKDQPTLWRDTVMKNDQATIAYVNLGIARTEAGAYDEAQALLERALDLDPDSALALNALGNAHKDTGRLQEAVPLYRQAIEIHDLFAVARVNLAATLYQLDPADGEVEAQLRRAIATSRRPPPHAHYLLGVVLGVRDQPAESLEQMRIAAKLRPDDADTQYQLGLALGRMNELNLAKTHLERAIALDTNHDRARTMLTQVRVMLMQTGVRPDAVH